MDIYGSLLAYLTLVLAVYKQVSVNAAFQNCKKFIMINESNYDKDPKSLEDLSRRPNGFLYSFAEYPATSTNLKNPCYFLTNLTDRSVEVMAQTLLPGSKVCVKDNNGKTDCSTGTINNCWEANSETVKYEFYCDPGSGCDSSVQFWFRLTPSEGDRDDWCTLLRSKGDFPKTLLPLPSQIPTQSTPTSSASFTVLSVILMYLENMLLHWYFR